MPLPAEVHADHVQLGRAAERRAPGRAHATPRSKSEASASVESTAAGQAIAEQLPDARRSDRSGEGHLPGSVLGCRRFRFGAAQAQSAARRSGSRRGRRER